MGGTPKQTVREGLGLLSQARVNVLGTVLTHLSADSHEYYY